MNYRFNARLKAPLFISPKVSMVHRLIYKCYIGQWVHVI